MTFTRLVSTGSYLPEKIVSNEDLSQIMDTSDEWIKTRTGIAQRHIANDQESSNDMAFHAALRALEDAPFDAQALDLILVATSTPEHVFPSNATQLQARLGCRMIPAMDVQAACSGFVYASALANAYIVSGMAKRVLVVGAEMMSSVINWQDRNTAVLFGDGAGAVIYEASDTPGIRGVVLHSDGQQRELLWAPRGLGSPAAVRNQREETISMQGRDVFKFAVKKLASLMGELLETCDMRADEIDFLVPHQANLRIIKATADHLELPMERVITTVDRHANTSAASVPLALDYGIRNATIKRGQNLLIEAFGGGFTWGGFILTY